VGAAEALGGFFKDRFGDTSRILANLAVPNAKNSPALDLQIIVAAPVPARLCMLAAVDLGHQARLSASKVNEIWADRQLPREHGSEA
jgi:hypothetical protein